MTHPIRDAVEAAMQRRSEKLDRPLLEAILALQERRQYDEDGDKRIQEMERLITEWCEAHAGEQHED